MSKDNLVQFPTSANNLPTVETVKAAMADARSEIIDDITMEFKNDILTMLSIAGFDPGMDEGLRHDAYLLIESVRSIVCRKFNVNHPFHAIAENLFTERGDDVIFRAPKFHFGAPTEKDIEETVETEPDANP